MTGDASWMLVVILAGAVALGVALDRLFECWKRRAQHRARLKR